MTREWEEGNEAYYEGASIQDCPYAFGCLEHQRWTAGFLFAAQSDPDCERVK